MRAGVRVHVGQQRLVGGGARRGPRRATASDARYDRTPCPSSGNEAATHCTRCTGEPSRASDDSTEDHAPTRRSCSSAPRRAKLLPRSASAAVSVRPARSCTTPMSCQSARKRRRVASAPMRPGAGGPAPPAGTPCPPAHRNGQPLVARAARHGHGGQRAVEDQDADGGGDADRVGLPAQDQHAEDQPDGDGDDLAGPPSRQRATALPRAEAVATSRAPRSLLRLCCSGPSPGGQTAGSYLMVGPCPSSPM